MVPLLQEFQAFGQVVGILSQSKVRLDNF